MSKNKMGMTLIILLLVVLLVLFAVGFGFLYKAMNKTNDATDTNIVVQQTVPIEDITVFPLGETIITNLLKGPDQKDHVIKISVNLGINTSKETSKEAENLISNLELKKTKTIIKDKIIDICRNKTYEEMEMTNAKTVVKDEILASLQEIFATNLIVDVYIDDFFTQ